MPLDALCLSGVVHELNTALAGAKVDKIYQPGRDEIVLALRAPADNVRLLLSANPNQPRLHLTQLPLENPDKPPMFCMLLRKHLSGARLLAVEQVPLERVVRLRFEALNELGDRVERKLVLEAISHHSNLLLLDGEDRILDCVRRVDSDLDLKSGNSGRLLQPGMFYRLPAAVAKADPTGTDREGLEELLDRAPEESQADKWLLDTFSGLSPLVCRELAFRAGGATDVRLHQLGPEGRAALLNRLEALQNTVKESRYMPVMITVDERPRDFSFLPIGQYQGAAEVRDYPTFSLLLDDFYAQRDQQERVRQKGQDLIRAVTNARDRTARKIGNQEKELAATRDRDRLRELGDILTSNFWQMEKGMARLRTVDFYDPEGKEIDIKLDPGQSL